MDFKELQKKVVENALDYGKVKLNSLKPTREY
jgi:hypothetical protein